VTGPPGQCGCGCALTPQTSAGFSAVQFAREVLGVEPLPWQRWLLIHAGELLPDGRFRFRTILILVARQNGKTSIIEIKNLWKMFVLGVALVIGTAQNLDISEESWDKAVEIVESIPELNAEVVHVDRTNGKKALRLTNGSRWKIAAASRKGGRGLTGDDVNLDELREHQNWQAWGAVTKTTMARPNAQTFAFSNAGDDRSVVLNTLQATGRALAKMAADAAERGLSVLEIPEFDSSFGMFEWSAPDDVRCTCPDRTDGQPHDHDCGLRNEQAWAQANPALGYTITRDAIESSLSTDPEAVFRTEVLCQHVRDIEEGIITTAQWVAVADPHSKRTGEVSLGVDTSTLRDFAAINVYGMRADGLGHCQLIDYRPGTDWIVPRLAELSQALGPVAIGMGKGTYESLKEDLRAAGLDMPEDPEFPQRGDLAVTGPTSMSAACAQFIDAVRQRSLRVVPSSQLDEAVAGAKTRTTGDTIAWARKDSAGDISPLGGQTVARWAYISRIDLVDQDEVVEPMVAWR
jgi:phage terminase large subunit-like protein